MRRWMATPTRSYGDAFADVYDEWYGDVSDVAATVSFIGELARQNTDLPVLELGVGTGRLAVPLAATGVRVVGVDASAAMLAKLAENDPSRLVTAHLGDMVEGLPDGPFAVVFVAFNTLFNLRDAYAPGGVLRSSGQAARARRRVRRRSVRSRIKRWIVGHRAFDHRRLRGVVVATHDDATPDRARVSTSRSAESGGVRLRPWAIRYATVEQLDDMAAAAGFRVDERWEDPKRTPFTVESSTHFSVYRTIHSSVRPDEAHDVLS